jgi:glycosyltransferase involved in cell wall biosynthesis
LQGSGLETAAAKGPRTRRLRVGVVLDGFVGRRAARGVELANGGVGVYADQLLRGLASLDAADLVLIRPGPLDLPVFRDPRFEVVSDPLLRRFPAARWLDVRLARIAAERALDLLHYPNQFGGAFLPRRVARVMTLHDLTPAEMPRFHPWWTVLGYRLLLAPALRRADAVIVDSEAVAAELQRRDGRIADRVCTVPLGVDSSFAPGRRTAGFCERLAIPERFVLSVGVLEPRKNHVAAVRALARLHAAGERVALVIAGRTGWGWRDPVAAADLEALRPWVLVRRDVPADDLVELYGRARALVYPSFGEGFGLPVLEAMACGCPVVTSDRSALPEVGGNAALYAPPDEPSAIGDRLLEVLRDAALAGDLAARGAERAAGFTWRRTAERTISVYERVASRRLSL